MKTWVPFGRADWSFASRGNEELYLLGMLTGTPIGPVHPAEMKTWVSFGYADWPFAFSGNEDLGILRE